MTWPFLKRQSRAIVASRWKLFAGTAVNNGQSVRISMTLDMKKNLCNTSSGSNSNGAIGYYTAREAE
jgi:hypothetical protein